MCCSSNGKFMQRAELNVRSLSQSGRPHQDVRGQETILPQPSNRVFSLPASQYRPPVSVASHVCRPAQRHLYSQYSREQRGRDPITDSPEDQEHIQGQLLRTAGPGRCCSIRLAPPRAVGCDNQPLLLPPISAVPWKRRMVIAYLRQCNLLDSGLA